jgi:hypothetical protein
MVRTSRLLAFVVLASFAFLTVGCGSNNKDKIVGKWRLAAENVPPEAQVLVGKMYIEFKPDGKVAMGVDTAALGPLEKVGMAGQPTTIDFATYKLRSGDGVDMTLLPEIKEQLKGQTPIRDGRVTIKIDGDNMTLTDAKDTVKFTRMK